MISAKVCFSAIRKQECICTTIVECSSTICMSIGCGIGIRKLSAVVKEKCEEWIFEYVVMGGRCFRPSTEHKSGGIVFLAISKLNVWVDSTRHKWTYPTSQTHLEREWKLPSTYWNGKLSMHIVNDGACEVRETEKKVEKQNSVFYEMMVSAKFCSWSYSE